jgi:hypothetical protein
MIFNVALVHHVPLLLEVEVVFKPLLVVELLTLAIALVQVTFSAVFLVLQHQPLPLVLILAHKDPLPLSHLEQMD